jgi:DNA-binding MarR family transcriptional regulator
VVRLTRAEVRRRLPLNLSLSQLRALSYLTAHPGAPLTGVADYVGVALPSASVLVAGLERRNLVVRLAASGDRRLARLRATVKGKAALRKATDAARRVLAKRLAHLPPRERAAVTRAMARVRAVMTP